MTNNVNRQKPKLIDDIFVCMLLQCIIIQGVSWKHQDDFKKPTVNGCHVINDRYTGCFIVLDHSF